MIGPHRLPSAGDEGAETRPANPEAGSAGTSDETHPPEQQARWPLPSGQLSRFRQIIRRIGEQLTHDGGHLEFAAAVDLGKAMFALGAEFDGGFGEPRQAVKGPAPDIAAGHLRAAAARLAGRPEADRLTRLANQLCRASSQAGPDAPEQAAGQGSA